MAQFATALLPLMQGQTGAIADFTDIVRGFEGQFERAYLRHCAPKLGLRPDHPDAAGLIAEFLAMLHAAGADFTSSFRHLSTGDLPPALSPSAEWTARWKDAADVGGLNQVNPAIIPRNHQVEAVIAACVQGDWSPFHALHQALATPFTPPDDPNLTAPPQPHEVVTQTFCGT